MATTRATGQSKPLSHPSSPGNVSNTANGIVVAGSSNVHVSSCEVVDFFRRAIQWRGNSGYDGPTSGGLVDNTLIENIGTPSLSGGDDPTGFGVLTFYNNYVSVTNCQMAYLDVGVFYQVFSHGQS